MKKTYQNPIAKNGDFADPFVLRYNGKYYLYATNPDIRCFTSDDLVEWKLEGPVIGEDVFGELVPFAPEVIYADGKFYMYTSPSGFGHYVLESDSPLGPFRKITENIGHEIDGTVFIDDDGKWYFYWAGFEGIWGCEMYSPTEFGEPVLTGADLHGWTEGPLVCKRDGIYYMTYTGNHYLSNGYRIQTAWSTDPLTGYRDDLYNPALIHTEGEGVGLGHSSTVQGPDLVSYYLVYHNLNEDATRDLNIDRIVWHKEATQILGPTRSPQGVPKRPDYSFPEAVGEKMLSWDILCGSWECLDGFYYSGSCGLQACTKEKFGEFTAEMNILIPSENQNAGIELALDSGIKYGLKFLSEQQKIEWIRKEKDRETVVGETTAEHMKLCNVLHTVKLCREKNRLQIFIDGRKMLEVPVEYGEIRLGYYAEKAGMGVGYTAVTARTYEQEKQTVIIPENCSCMPVCGKGMGVSDEQGRRILKQNEETEYCFGTDGEKDYNLYITQMEEKAGKMEIFLDGKHVDMPETESTLKKIQCHLEKGEHIFRLVCKTKCIGLERVQIVPAEEGEESGKKQNITIGTYGKEIFHDCAGDDYLLEVKLSVQKEEEPGRGGVLFRVTEPAEGGEGKDKKLGIYFFKGYSVSVDGERLRVEKHCYDHVCLGEIPFIRTEKETICLYIKVQGNWISIFDEKKYLLLKVQDPKPLVYGAVGVWTQGCTTRLESLDWSKLR